jgi:hypothetical protein
MMRSSTLPKELRALFRLGRHYVDAGLDVLGKGFRDRSQPGFRFGIGDTLGGNPDQLHQRRRV